MALYTPMPAPDEERESCLPRPARSHRGPLGGRIGTGYRQNASCSLSAGKLFWASARGPCVRRFLAEPTCPPLFQIGTPRRCTVLINGLVLTLFNSEQT
jgi:hypothetical protein